jgi:hypothetical protein
VIPTGIIIRQACIGHYSSWSKLCVVSLRRGSSGENRRRVHSSFRIDDDDNIQIGYSRSTSRFQIVLFLASRTYASKFSFANEHLI